MTPRNSLLPDVRQGTSHPANRRIIILRCCGLLVFGTLLLGLNTDCEPGKRDVTVKLDTLRKLSVQVDAGMYMALEVQVSESKLEVPAMAPSIVADFTVASPAYPNNTIDYFIVDMANFELYKARKDFTKIYALENTSGGNPFPTLPFAEGIYYVIFSNYNDPLYRKDISPCLITLEYWVYK
jgi:hypothetical protein